MNQTTHPSTEPTTRYFKRVPSDAGGYVRPWDVDAMYVGISKKEHDAMNLRHGAEPAEDIQT